VRRKIGSSTIAPRPIAAGTSTQSGQAVESRFRHPRLAGQTKIRDL